MNEVQNFAPIIIFVYNRAFHTRELLKSLSLCLYAKDSPLYIFSDAAKNEGSLQKVEEVRSVIHEDIWNDCFKRVHIIEATKNKGLANSIIDGVSQVIHEFGRVIVVEDDNRVSTDFIDFMNRALDFYCDIERIGYIGGYTLPIRIPDDYQYDIFAMERGSSYAWATWQKYWDLVDWKVTDYDSFKHNKKLRKRFDECGPRSSLLDLQMSGKIDSWAIRFSYSMFKMGKMAILPTKTRVENIGFDGTGIHNKSYETKYHTKIEDNLKSATFLDVDIDERIKKEFKRIFKKPPLVIRVLRKIGVLKNKS